MVCGNISLMLHTPFYDPTKSYEENYEKGPYGAFADGKIYQDNKEPSYDLWGHKLNLPFGIPAGPVINSNFVKASFEKGFDIVVYKTVRTDTFPCHPFPNVLAVDPHGDLDMEKAKKQLVGTTDYKEPLSITNSFGVPSKPVDYWQEDARKAVSYAGKGQLLIMCFMGTVKPNQTQQEFVDDYAKGAKLSLETGAKVFETNLSCPNIGNEGLVCYNLEVTKQICKTLREIFGKLPFIIKIGYFQDETQLAKLAEIANKYVDGIAAINTIPVEVVNEKGEQALPGPNRLKSGICGASIKWAGLDMVKRLDNLRRKNNYTYKIFGTGGVTVAEDYMEYKDAGADVVMSATGAMWDPFLAQEIKKIV